MSRALAALLMAGCGRVDFDAHLDASSVDATGDAAMPQGLATVCGFSNLTVLHDGIVADDYAGDRISNAIATQCAAGQTQRTVSQGDPGILDPTTNEMLLAPSDLAVVGGGDANQRATAYFMSGNLWPIVQTGGATDFTWTDRASGNVVLQAPYSSLTATHDYGQIVLIRDAANGATLVTGFGTGAPGSLAAGYLFETVIAPAIRSDSYTWYAFEWTNGDTDNNPTPGDTLTVIAAGP